jgi:DNA modification methylase
MTVLATIQLGDCRDIIAELPDCSVDSIVTDPPYELGFMGKAWDGSDIAYDPTLWAQCLRVLKPGGHLLAFGGTRTYHRMAVAIEDAGFEIRDSIHWLYGSGFPKSLDVSKAIDKAAGAEREIINRGVAHCPGMAAGRDCECGRGPERSMRSPTKHSPATRPNTAAAAAAAGWGTALKPAHEPIVVARKPLFGTVAATVLAYGTGALNIDGCRITSAPGDEPLKWSTPRGGIWTTDTTATATATVAGRWPANLVFTHAADCADDCATDCPVAEIDRQSDTVGASRFFTVTEWDPTADIAPFRFEAKPSRAERDAGLAALPAVGVHRYNEGIGVAGASVDRNHHPTVKPIALMRWLVRLVTPPGGTVLEPFAGSGTTMAAAILEDFHVLGCELTADYLPIIEGRIAWARSTRDAIPPTLFDQVQP